MNTLAPHQWQGSTYQISFYQRNPERDLRNKHVNLTIDTSTAAHPHHRRVNLLP